MSMRFTYFIVAWLACTLTVNAQQVGIFEGMADIGDVGIAGDMFYDDGPGLYLMDASGSGLDDFEDSFFFAFREISGNFAIEGLPFTVGSGRSGLMIRESLDAGSPFAAYMSNGQDMFPQFRTLPNEATSDDGEVTADSMLDGTVRLERIGNSIHFYTLDPDENWVLQQTEIIEMQDTVYVGLAGTAGNNNSLEFFEFEFVEIEEYPFNVVREFNSENPTPGDALTVTLNASSSDVVNATVTEIIPNGAVISDFSASGGELVELDNGNLQWSLVDFSGEAALTYQIDTPVRNVVIWDGTFTDGEMNINESGLRSGFVGGELFIAESLELQARESISVHPLVPTFIEAEWGGLTGEEKTFGLFFDPRSESGLLVHQAAGSSSQIYDSILEYKLNVQEAGTYYFFAQTRKEDSQSDSFYMGFNTIEALPENGFPMGGEKNMDRRWWEHFTEGGNFWERTGVKREIELSAGEYSFFISPRESNGNIDWFVITANPTINIQNFEPRQQYYTITRELPEIADELPESITVVLDLGVVEGSQLDLAVTENIPEGWALSNISASNGETEVDGETIQWTLTDVGADVTLSYDVQPSADSNFGAWYGVIEDLNSGEIRDILGDLIVPENIPFQIRTEPIDVVADDVTFIQAEAPHAVSGDYIVQADASLVSKLYAMPSTSGRSGGILGGQELTFELNVLESGTYYVFANMRSEDANTDSYYIGFNIDFEGMSDGTENDQFGLPVGARGEFGRNWHYIHEEGERFWVTTEDPKPNELSAGLNTLSWHSREPLAKVDWIAITTDPTLDIEEVLEPGQEPDTLIHDFMLY